MTQTNREIVAGQLAAARSAAETKRQRGESDAAEQAQIGRLEGELKHLNEINEQARPAVEATERRERGAREAEEHAAVQRRNREEREYKEALEQHYRDRMEFYRQTQGTPRDLFDEEIWPEIRRAFVASEPDAVDLERWERSESVF